MEARNDFPCVFLCKFLWGTLHRKIHLKEQTSHTKGIYINATLHLRIYHLITARNIYQHCNPPCPILIINKINTLTSFPLQAIFLFISL